MFDLRAARYFVAVAEELHFGRAAERLQMSQPPLSQAILQLERDVGATLFERTNRRVSITSAGEAFLPACRALLRQAGNVQAIPRLAAEGIRSQLAIGAVTSFLSWPLPDALERFRAAMPHVAVHVTELDTDEAVGFLESGAIDVALARLSAARSGVETNVLLREEFCVLMPDTHPLATGSGRVDLAEFAAEPWVWLSREVSPDYHDEMAATCRSAGFSPRVAHSARSIASQIAMVKCGPGITVIPASSAKNVPQGVTARTIKAGVSTVTMSVTTRFGADATEATLARLIAETVAGPTTS